ncbi:MAG: hypothetical protein M3R61_12695, partial [Chloroflexota bacterium]|nr:hypothetical protein [Chloroflexota bacterium]
PEQHEFARRLLTARDHEMPIPRAAAMQIWAKIMDERRLTELIESLRRRALIFPTHAFYPNSYRDVYFQWLPMNSAVPVMKWDLRTTDDRRQTIAGSPVVEKWRWATASPGRTHRHH